MRGTSPTSRSGREGTLISASPANPHTASFIRRDQLLPYTSKPKRRAIRAAGGEAPAIRALMTELEPEMELQEGSTGSDGTVIGPPSTKSSAPRPVSQVSVLPISLLILYLKYS